MADRLTQRQIKEAVEELDALCRDEYGEDRSYGLLELLDDPDRQLAQIRLQRLTGIALKGKFAERESASEPYQGEPYGYSGPPMPSVTGARWRWEWRRGRLEDNALQRSVEFRVLDQMRQELPTLVGDWLEPTWDDFLREVDTERGLYKVLTLWLMDKWEGRETQSIKAYLAQKETPKFASLLSLADFTGQQALGLALSPILPLASVVVPLVIIAAEYGY
jgi:hypothetical protein